MVSGRRLSVLAALGVGSLGTVAGGTYRLLSTQARHARRVIGKLGGLPPRADGVYDPDGGPVDATGKHALLLVVLGDSTAAGLGCLEPEELPGVLLARGLAEETGSRVRLATHARDGANSRALDAQVGRALATEHPATGAGPDAAMIMIGANDVTARHSVARSAQRLGDGVARLRAAGTVVVVGTCPDLGAVRPIPQPLRGVVRTWSLRLARAQQRTVRVAGGHPVALGDLLAPEFLASPEQFFSGDQFHPSAAGYEAAAGLLLPALCSGLGVWGGGRPAERPLRSAVAEARRPTVRLTAALNRELYRRARVGGSAAARVLRLGARGTGQ